MKNTIKNDETPRVGQYRANLKRGCVTTMDKKEVYKLLSFICMSDGALNMHIGCINASFKISQTKGKDGLVFLAKELLDFLDIGNTITEYTAKNGATYINCISRVHPILTKLYYRIYMDGRRVLDPHAFKQLDWECLAILYMSDGNITFNPNSNKTKASATLNLCRLSYAEFMWLNKQVEQKLGIVGTIHKCGKYFRLGFNNFNSAIFFHNIRPYMLTEYTYKLPYIVPQTDNAVGDEIVCTL